MIVKYIDEKDDTKNNTIEFYCRKCNKYVSNVHKNSLDFIICTSCKTTLARLE